LSYEDEELSTGRTLSNLVATHLDLISVGEPASLAKLLGKSGTPAALLSPTQSPICKSLRMLLVSPASLPPLGWAALGLDNKAVELVLDSVRLKGPMDETELLLLCGRERIHEDPLLVPGIATALAKVVDGDTGDIAGGVSWGATGMGAVEIFRPWTCEVAVGSL
jgi:hypothetical protein